MIYELIVSVEAKSRDEFLSNTCDIFGFVDPAFEEDADGGIWKMVFIKEVDNIEEYKSDILKNECIIDINELNKLS